LIISSAVYTVDDGGNSLLDPCARHHCSFGARCVPSPDGRSARCQCDTRCDPGAAEDSTDPVCGDDGLDYASECELRRRACVEMKNVHKKYNGKCGELRDGVRIPVEITVFSMLPWTKV